MRTTGQRTVFREKYRRRREMERERKIFVSENHSAEPSFKNSRKRRVGKVRESKRFIVSWARQVASNESLAKQKLGFLFVRRFHMLRLTEEGV